jgi:hypothetical protein
MKTREPFQLKTLTAIHNMILCVWSLAMFIGTVVFVFERALSKGVSEGSYQI